MNKGLFDLENPDRKQSVQSLSIADRDKVVQKFDMNSKGKLVVKEEEDIIDVKWNTYKVYAQNMGPLILVFLTFIEFFIDGFIFL